MPGMACVLHLFDSQTLPAGLTLLFQLHRLRADDVLARVGGEGGRHDLPKPDCVIRCPWPWVLTAAPGMRELAAKRGINVIHCWSGALAEPAAAVAPAMLMSVLRPPGRKGIRPLRLATRDGAMALATSNTLARTLVSEGIPSERLHVVPPAADTVDVDGAARQKARRRLGLSEGKFTLLAPAEHDDDRGPYWVAWAAGILREIEDDFQLIVLGASPAVERARRLSHRVGIGRHVCSPGPGDESVAWAAADIAILYDRDGFGMAGVTKALAARVPIVATRAGELGDELAHEQTALLADPGNPRRLAQAVWRLSHQGELAEDLVGRAAADLGHLLDVPGMIGRIETLYERAATGCDALV